MCETWLDHDWGHSVFIAQGHHPTRGRFLRYEVKCSRCGKRMTETKWLDNTEEERAKMGRMASEQEEV